MAGEKRLTVKSLNEEINKLKDEVKVVPELRRIIKELQETVQELIKDKKDLTNEENIVMKPHECRKCDKTFPTRKNLRQHIVEDHQFKIECNNCEKVFMKRCDLELQILSEHETAEVFECSDCEKTFVLKWRLHKHRMNHSIKGIRQCYYFNNNLDCPFSQLGCMFAHEPSKTCKFDQNCATKFCAYKHSMIEENRSVIEDIEEEFEGIETLQENVNDHETDDDQVECPKCCCTFLDQEELDYHVRVDHGQ